MIDMDDSSQSDVSPCQPSHALNTHTHAFSETHCRPRKHPHPPPFNSPELLITWAAFQRTSDYTFSAAPQAQRWRMRKEEVLAQLAGHGCSETTVLHANQFPTMHCGNARLWLDESGGCCRSHSVFVLFICVVYVCFFYMEYAACTVNKTQIALIYIIPVAQFCRYRDCVTTPALHSFV